MYGYPKRYASYGIYEIAERYPGLYRQAERGSRLAAVKLKCIECMGGNGGEARDCTSTDCPLWGVVGKGWGKFRTRAVKALSGASDDAGGFDGPEQPGRADRAKSGA